MRLRTSFQRMVVIGSAALSLALAPAVRAENWPQFRGPASGLVVERQLPTTWGPEENVAWKIKLPGMAWSQPVVWDNRIYVTSAATENQTRPAIGGPGGGRFGGAPGRPPGGLRAPGGFGRGPGRSPEAPDQVYRWVVMCLDRDSGKVMWEQVAHEGKPTIPTHRSNTFASETPIVDGQHVYVYFGMTGLYCYNLDGKLVWEKDLGSYPMSNGWGTGSSPALDGDRLFIQCDNEEKSFLVALDKHNGNELWRVDREEESNWSTPYVWRNKNRTELVTAGGGKMRSYDPATGKLVWELAGVNGRCSATPVGSDELLYVGVGGGRGGAGPLVAIRADAEGELDVADKDASPGIAWSTPRAGPPMASPLIYDGLVYVLEQRGGIIGCYDAKTGEEKYHQRIEGASGFTASPWSYGGKIYCLDETGNTLVLAPGPELKIEATNKLNDQFWSSAAIAGNHLLLRGVEHLYSIAPE